ncbi:hypothetical protein NOGI109294_26130 [Nocardiopsis gilva]
MLVSYRQPLGVGYRQQPLHVGWTRYLRLWLDHHTDHLREEMRPGWSTLTAAAAEIRWVTVLTVTDAAARIERVRPDPWPDSKLLTALTVTAFSAVSLATVLGFSLSEWWADTSNDVLPAAAGALVVGLALFALSFLVFASGRRGRAEER